MQRCDFASVMAIIRDDLIEGAFSNQMDFVEKLFASFLNEVEFYFDQGLVNKWFNVLVKVSPQICRFYAAEEDGTAYFAEDITQYSMSRSEAVSNICADIPIAGLPANESLRTHQRQCHGSAGRGALRIGHRAQRHGLLPVP